MTIWYSSLFYSSFTIKMSCQKFHFISISKTDMKYILKRYFFLVTFFIINIHYVRIIYYNLINLKKYFNICVSNQPSNKANIHKYLQYFYLWIKLITIRHKCTFSQKIVDNELKESWYPRMFISSVFQCSSDVSSPWTMYNEDCFRYWLPV